MTPVGRSLLLEFSSFCSTGRGDCCATFIYHVTIPQLFLLSLTRRDIWLSGRKEKRSKTFIMATVATDAEKGPTAVPAQRAAPDVDHDDRSDSFSIKASSLFHKALRMGRVEEKGIQPIAVEDRQMTRFYNIFTVWFSINANILG